MFTIYCWLLLGLVNLPRLGDPYENIYENPRKFCESHSPGRILRCAYTTCSYGQILLLARFPEDHLAQPLVSFHIIVIFVLYMLVLSVLFLVFVISLLPRLFINFLGHCIDASTLSWMLVSPLPPSFIDSYSLSLSSLGCSALYIVMSFLFLLCICWSSHEYLTKGTAIIIIIIIIWIHISYVREAYDKFPDFFRLGTFIDRTHMKL